MYQSRNFQSAGVFNRYLLLVLLIVSFADANAGQFDKGLLWKIDSPDGKTSHLLGTIHLEDSRVTNLPVLVQRAFDRSSRVTLEITMDPAALISLSVAMMLTDGRDLRSVIGDRLYLRSIKALEDYGAAELVVAQMKPWAIATTLLTPKPKTGVVLDMKLYQEALAAGKQVDGLETAAEQLGVFDGMDEKLQIKMLQETLDQLPKIKGMYRELVEVYLQRDLAKMVALNDRYMDMSDRNLAEQFNQRVIVDRNHRMAERMESRLIKGNVFVAVGALHLPGKEGLLALLEKRGYKLTRIY